MSATLRIRLIGEWERTRRLMSKYRGGGKFRQSLDKAINAEAQAFAAEVRKGIKSGAPAGKKFEANRPLVVYRKKSNKPLIDNGDLRNSVRVKRVAQMEYFAGVHRTAKQRSMKGAHAGESGGQPLVNIAEVHEFGKVITIKITKKMQRWFFAELVRAGRFAARRRSKGTKPAPSSPSGGARPSFKPGAVLIIRIKPRPFLTPVFEDRRGGAEARIIKDLARRLGGDFGRG